MLKKANGIRFNDEQTDLMYKVENSVNISNREHLSSDYAIKIKNKTDLI